MIVREAYNDWSDTYDEDRNLTRDLDHKVTREILKDIKCEAILELGCGTGKNTHFLSGLCQRLLAVDFSEGMLSRAKEKLQLDNTLFLRTDITEKWPCENSSIDLIVCNLVLEHIENLPFIFSEARRVLKGGGMFFICELHPFRQYKGKKARFERGEQTIEIHAFVHNISDFFAAAKSSGLTLKDINEWNHESDQSGVPRVISLLFKKEVDS